jgi:hypothetical protein
MVDIDQRFTELSASIIRAIAANIYQNKGATFQKRTSLIMV